MVISLKNMTRNPSAFPALLDKSAVRVLCFVLAAQPDGQTILKIQTKSVWSAQQVKGAIRSVPRVKNALQDSTRKSMVALTVFHAFPANLERILVALNAVDVPVVKPAQMMDRCSVHHARQATKITTAIQQHPVLALGAGQVTTYTSLTLIRRSV